MDDCTMPQLNVVWEGPLYHASSLATINREQGWNLLRSGAIRLVMVPSSASEGNVVVSSKLELLKQVDVRTSEPELISAPVVWVRHKWPPSSERPQGATWIIMQP